jgi:hypothetical protein
MDRLLPEACLMTISACPNSGIERGAICTLQPDFGSWSSGRIRTLHFTDRISHITH